MPTKIRKLEGMEQPKLGFRVENKKEGKTLIIPQISTNWCLLWFCFAWLWGNMAFVFLSQYEAFGSLMLISAGVFAALAIGAITQKSKVTRTSKTLVVAKCFLGMSSRVEYDMAHVRSIRTYGPKYNTKNSEKLQILFDYGGETVTLAKRLSPPKAQLIVEQLFQP